jgi:hypothetical protein
VSGDGCNRMKHASDGRAGRGLLPMTEHAGSDWLPIPGVFRSPAPSV